MKKYNICDYSNLDYKKCFWDAEDRRYEDNVERIALRKLMNECTGSIIDVGAGYGRLVDEYTKYFHTITLFDYAPNLLEQAQKRIDELQIKNAKCINGSFYDLHLINDKYDCAIAIRVLHHVENVEDFFTEVNRSLYDGGCFIFEYANKRNFLEILRYIFKRKNIHPFSLIPSKRGDDVYYNFHPKYIENMLKECGFQVEYSLSVSLFRNKFVKKIFGWRFLSFIERIFQRPFSLIKLSPSIFMKVRKIQNI